MSKDLMQLDPDFRKIVGCILTTCDEHGVELRPYNAVRDPWAQARLWRQSRSIEEIMRAVVQLEHQGAPFLAQVLQSVGPQYGAFVTDHLPGASWHQWGEALDCYWYLDGEAEWSIRKKVEISDSRKINGYRLFGEQAIAAGATSGGFWSDLLAWPHIQKRPKPTDHYYSWEEIDSEMQCRFVHKEPSAEAFSLSPAAVPEPVPSSDDHFIKLDGDKFSRNGQPFKFFGVNIRSLAHYSAQYSGGAGFPYPIINMDEQVRAQPARAQIEQAYSFGARVIRLFLANNNATPNEIITSLQNLLALITNDLGYRDLYLLPALTNFYDSVPYYVRGDNGEVDPSLKYYLDGHLSPEWYQRGYQRFYQPFVEKVVGHFKDHPNIFAWEVGNELSLANIAGMTDEEKARTIADFMRRLARVIRASDPNHLITTGMTSTAKAWMPAHNVALRAHLYELFDFVTIHYPYDKPNPFGPNDADADLARNVLRKPFIIEEDLVCQSGFEAHQGSIQAGCEACADRSHCFRHRLTQWMGDGASSGRGASGYMIWGFDGAHINDDDPGGIGPKNPSDRIQLRTLFSTFAERLASEQSHS